MLPGSKKAETNPEGGAGEYFETLEIPHAAPGREEEKAFDRAAGAEEDRARLAPQHTTVTCKSKLRQGIPLHPNSPLHSFLDLPSSTNGLSAHVSYKNTEETQSGFCFNQKQMLSEKDVMECREHQSQLPSLSPGTLSQPSTAPHAANLRAEKQRARGSGRR